MLNAPIVPTVLFLLGIGFLAANLRIVFQYLRFLRLRSTALLTWPGQTPPYYGVLLGFGVVLGVLVFVKLVVQQRPPPEAFGTIMMFVYYGYILPLSLRIGRGFYANGVWADTGFIPYSEIGGVRWQEGSELALVVTYRARLLARRLIVPEGHYGAVRRLLRDKIAAHDIQFSRSNLDLGLQDARDNV